MKYVKILIPLQNYKIDDIAALEDKIADKVIDSGYGEAVDLESTKLSKGKDK